MPKLKPNDQPISDEEEAALSAGIARDPDNPELTEAFWKNAKSGAEVPDAWLPPHARRHRGPQKAPTKQQVTLRLDRDILDHFRATGKGWTTRLNDALRKVAGL